MSDTQIYGPPISPVPPNAPPIAKFVMAVGVLAMTTGATVIIGWLLDVSHLKSALPGMVAMKFNTALLFVLTGLSFCIVTLQHHYRSKIGVILSRKRWITTVSSAVSCLIALITLSQYIFDIDTGLDQLFFAEPAGAILTVHLGRMALSTAVCFALLNVALLLLPWNEKQRDLVPQIAAGITALIAYQAVIGYTLGTRMLYVWGQPFTAMAVHTASLFFFLSIGLLLISPLSAAMKVFTSNYAASRVIRGFLPIIMILPLFLAWLSGKSVALGMFTPTYGNAIGVSLNIVCMIIILAIISRALYISEVREQSTKENAVKDINDTLENLRKAVATTIQVLVSAAEARDPYTSGHQIRVADLARAIATEMGLPDKQIEGIRMAGSIHDIGKISIPAEILSKPTKLSELEYSLIKTHSQKGYEMLKEVESPWPMAEIVYQHHEHVDGSGYPRNLKGDQILIEARILTVSDVVEAMASHRPYRAGLGIDAALDEIGKNRGVYYDKAAVDACLKLFREKGYDGLDYK